ncbi:hypothetical protein, partial [Haloechinothrix salitolerans]|uniref:hypothetical protein n=1 Tax=Haloechinothrix salitolerans TaxID=926830 RepID=UPI0035EB217F
ATNQHPFQNGPYAVHSPGNNGHPMAKGVVAYWYAGYNDNNVVENCLDRSELPEGHLAVLNDFYIWTGTEWWVCHSSDWHYNKNWAHKYSYRTTWGFAPCGSGYYGTVSYGYAYSLVRGWLGGDVWSGYHWLPS